LETVFESEL